MFVWLFGFTAAIVVVLGTLLVCLLVAFNRLNLAVRGLVYGLIELARPAEKQFWLALGTCERTQRQIGVLFDRPPDSMGASNALIRLGVPDVVVNESRYAFTIDDEGNLSWQDGAAPSLPLDIRKALADWLYHNKNIVLF